MRCHCESSAAVTTLEDVEQIGGVACTLTRKMRGGCVIAGACVGAADDVACNEPGLAGTPSPITSRGRRAAWTTRRRAARSVLSTQFITSTFRTELIDAGLSCDIAAITATKHCCEQASNGPRRRRVRRKSTAAKHRWVCTPSTRHHGDVHPRRRLRAAQPVRRAVHGAGRRSWNKASTIKTITKAEAMASSSPEDHGSKSIEVGGAAVASR